MIERITVWRCIGCGRIDAPQPCVGICQDRKVQLIEATDCDRLLSRSADFESLIRMLAQTTPHEGQWEQSYRRFQEAARRLLAK